MLTLRTVNRRVGKRWIVDSNIDGKRVRRFFTSKSAGQTYLAELRHRCSAGILPAGLGGILPPDSHSQTG